MKKELIAFKGVNEGIYISVKGDDLAPIKKELNTKMENSASFYKGTRLLDIKSEELSLEDREELKMILKYKYDLIIEEEDAITSPCSNKDQATNCGMTKFLYGTIRSGRAIEYHGNIVIVGDVNPGAIIQAAGNIIVLGTLRGVGHAGMNGNNEAIVAAYNLQPMQLRIGDRIARPPDQVEGSLKMPEVAKIKEGEVIIEPYLPNK